MSSTLIKNDTYEISCPTIALPAPGSVGVLYLNFEYTYVQNTLSDMHVEPIIGSNGLANFVASKNLPENQLWWAKACADNCNLIIINIDGCNALELQLALMASTDKRPVILYTDSEEPADNGYDNGLVYGMMSLAASYNYLTANENDLSEIITAYYLF